MSKKKMFVMCGGAGSGKSTWIKEHLHADVVAATLSLPME